VESAFPEVEIAEVRSFWLDVIVRRARGKLLRLHDMGWHSQHGRAALYGYVTPSHFVARSFPVYCYVHQHAGRCFSPPDRFQAEASLGLYSLKEVVPMSV
jgi:hypothetical protein